MNISRRCYALALAATLVAAALPATAHTDGGRVIVKFRSAVALEQAQALRSPGERAAAVAQALRERAQALGARRGLALRSGAGLDGRMQVVLADGLDSTALAQRLAADADVAWAVPDQRRHVLRQPSDPLFLPTATPPGGTAAGQWYLRRPQATTLSLGTELVAPIDAERAWDVTTGTASVVVAVLDTGVRYDHPDLAGKLLPGYDMVTDPGVANDGDGRDADASDPGDWISRTEAASGSFPGCGAAPSSWHGTQVAGLVGAATDNGLGMAGGGWRTRVLPVRVLGKCGGYDSDILAGLRWAAGLPVDGAPANPTPADVINLSLGGEGRCSSAYAETLAAVTTQGALGRGSVVVVAAGNSAGRAVATPANCPGVVSVGAVRHIGTKVGFSDLGPEITLAAPGGNCVNLGGSCVYPMLSTTDTGTTVPQGPGYTGSADAAVGTSFSAPLVAATAALMRTAHRDLPPEQVRAALQASARPFPQSGAPPTTSASGATIAVAACQPPGNADQLECYCTSTTCGAGLLDAGAAVAAVARLQPWVELAGAAGAVPQPAQPLVLSAAATVVPPGRTLVSQTWSLVDGGGIVALPAGAASVGGATLGLTPSAAGSFTVRLSVADSSGATASTDVQVQVGAGTPVAAATDGGSGGGAMSWAWLAGLLAAAQALRRPALSRRR